MRDKDIVLCYPINMRDKDIALCYVIKIFL